MTAPRVACVTRVDAVAPQRWRNGGGWTRELLATPTGDDWRVRISVADIDADGPFSIFPGVQRHFAVLQGAGVELTIDSARHTVTRDSPALRFDGAATTTCRLLSGPTRDLNLMVRHGEGALVPVEPGARWVPRTASCGLFAAAAGLCRSGGRGGNGGGEAIAVPSMSLAWFDRAPASLVFDARGWWLAA